MYKNKFMYKYIKISQRYSTTVRPRKLRNKKKAVEPLSVYLML